MKVNKRSLGASGLEITTVGFGAWAIGGGGWSFGWGPQDDKVSIDTMRHAVDIGINWIDTAAVYGLGHSEEVVGRFLRSLPASERPYVFTKCGLISDKRDPMQEPKRDLRPESIRIECEPRCGGLASTVSTFTNSIGLMRRVQPSKIPGVRWCA